MKLALIGTGNMPLLQWILDGTNDDAIINMTVATILSRSRTMSASFANSSVDFRGKVFIGESCAAAGRTGHAAHSAPISSRRNVFMKSP